MKRFDVDDIMSLCPCDDWPRERVEAVLVRPMTISEIMELVAVPSSDRLWLGTRPGVLSDAALRVFACDCAERAVQSLDDPDPALIKAVAVARRSLAAASSEDLVAAKVSIRCATRDAIEAAAGHCSRATGWAAETAALAVEAAALAVETISATVIAEAAATWAIETAAWAAGPAEATAGPARIAERAWQLQRIGQLAESEA